jgi:selenocysteine lyase/cysteine desulfurase
LCVPDRHLCRGLGSTDDDGERVRAALEAEGFDVPLDAGADELTTRISGQIYNERADIERLADAVVKLPT